MTERGPRVPLWAWLTPFWLALLDRDIDAFLEKASRRNDPEWWAEHDKVHAEVCELKLHGGRP